MVRYIEYHTRIEHLEMRQLAPTASQREVRERETERDSPATQWAKLNSLGFGQGAAGGREVDDNAYSRRSGRFRGRPFFGFRHCGYHLKSPSDMYLVRNIYYAHSADAYIKHPGSCL